MLIIAQVQSSVLPTGAATETTLAAILAKLNASVAVTGPLTDTQLRAAPVPVTGPLTDTQLRASAVLVGAVGLPLPTGAATAAKQPAFGTPGVSSTDVVTVQGIAGGAALAISAAALPLPTGAAQDATLAPMVNACLASTLRVSVTAAVNNGVTCTLPAPGPGLFHYITRIELIKLYAVVGVASGAGVIVTSTNLPGNPSWTTEQMASPAGTCSRVIWEEPPSPMRSLAANVATTFIAPNQLQTIWRWNVSYYTAP